MKTIQSRKSKFKACILIYLSFAGKFLQFKVQNSINIHTSILNNDTIQLLLGNNACPPPKIISNEYTTLKFQNFKHINKFLKLLNARVNFE